MEYTKDIILNVNYGQAEKKQKFHWIKGVVDTISEHKLLVSVISITMMLMILDFILISSFVNILSNM